MNGLALCAGYGGLELAIERVFPTYRTVCYVEGEAFAAQHLVKKMEEGRLDNAPIWSNVRTFDGNPWRGKVDIMSGGFPCQPYSSAGKQLAERDQRDLWNDFVRIVGEVRPGFLFFENVPGIVKWRLEQIVLDLNKLGYDVAWGIIGASDVGAPHRRKRWFLFGVRNDTNPDHPGKRTDSRTIRQKDWNNIGGLCSNVSNTNDRGIKISVERKNPSIELFGGFSEEGTIDRWDGSFNTWWKTEPRLGRLVDGASNWVDKLRILGNGVVPQQAYSALQILGGRLACGIVANLEPKG